MSMSQEAVSGTVGVVLGAAVPPNTEWFIELHDVWVFMWPLVSGALMALGTHIVRKLIEKKSKKNDNEKS